MWYIILYYIVIFKFPVSANMFQVRSVADMTNIHRTKVMPRILPPEPQLFPNHEPTTCIDIAGRYEGGIYKNQERVCNPIQRWPETKRQVISTPAQILLRQRRPEPAEMIKPQMMLPKPSVRNNLEYPQNVASTPRQVKMPQQFRASLRPALRPSQHAIRQAVHRVNKDYQEYQLLRQAAIPYSENRDHQEYQLFPQDTPPDNENRGQQEHQPVFFNDGNQHRQAVNQDDENENDQPLYLKAHSTSTAAPVFNQGFVPTNNDDINNTPRSTTSTMPPFPGGFTPGDADFSGQQAQVCNGKAKCNQYVWTTKKKHHKKTTEEFLLWTP